MHRKLTLLYILLITLFFSGIGNSARAQLTINPDETADMLVSRLIGFGVTYSDATLDCPGLASGSFTSIAGTLGFDSGILLTSGRAQTPVPPDGFTVGADAPASDFASSSLTGPVSSDPQLASLVTGTQNGMCRLEFDFIPTGDTIKFDYIFASEEYPEFACTSFNDVFGFFIEGPGITGYPNIALLPGTTTPVTINTINDASCGIAAGGDIFYIDNSGDEYVVYDGLTTVLTAISPVTPCSTYHLKLAIADLGDNSYDSGTFIKAGSLSSNAVKIDPAGVEGLAAYPEPTLIRGCGPGSFTISRAVVTDEPLTVTLSIGGTAVNGVDYGLIDDEITIPADESSAVITIDPASLATDVGPKTVTVYLYSTAVCAAATIIDSATITILDPARVVITMPADGDTTICEGTSTTLIAQGNILGMDYLWTPSSGLASPTNDTTLVTPLISTCYTVTASLPGTGCPSAKDTACVNITPKPIVIPTSNTPVCDGGNIELTTPDVPGATFSWEGPMGFTSSLQNPIITGASFDDAGVYTVMADIGGCASLPASTTVVINPNKTNTDDTLLCPGESYIYGGTPIDRAGVFDGFFTTSTGCDSVVTITVTMPPVNQQFVYDTICQGTIYTLNGISYDATDVYDQIYTSAVGCDSIITLNLTVNPTITTLFTDTICQGFTYTLNGITYSTSVVDTQEYVTFLGCDSMVILNLTVLPDPVVDFILPENVCIFDSAPVTVSIAANDPAVWNWNFSDATIVSGSGAGPYQISFNSIGTRTISVTPTSGFGCIGNTVSHDITVRPIPDSKIIDVSAANICAGDTVFLQAQPGAQFFYEWFPREQILSFSNDGNAQYAADQDGYVVLESTDWYGCSGRDSVMITTYPCCEVSLPNAFTPNSDGRNDDFKIITIGEQRMQYFMVVNRWGQKVFETVDESIGWDGTFNGVKQPMDTYYYTIKYQCATGQLIEKKGDLILIR